MQSRDLGARPQTDVTRCVDLRGLKCPLPVLRARKILSTAHAGDIFELRCTDPMAAIDIPVMLQQDGHHLLAQKSEGNEVHFVVEASGVLREA